MLFATANDYPCSKLYYLARGYTELAPTQVLYTKDKSGGDKVTDILNTTPLCPIVVRTWVRDLMLEHGITGWREFPVRVVDFDGNEIADYCGIGVTGRCGGLDASKLWTCKRADGFIMYHGVDIDTSTWDGSDIFMLPSRLYTFTTSKVKTLFNKYKVSNARFDDLDDWYFYHLDKVTELLTGNMTEILPDGQTNQFVIKK